MCRSHSLLQVSEVQGLSDSGGLAGAQVSILPLILLFIPFLLLLLLLFFTICVAFNPL